MEWQFRNRKGQFRRLSGGLQTAHKPFAFTAKLKRKGRWRVRVVHQAVAPYKRSASAFMAFTLK